VVPSAVPPSASGTVWGEKDKLTKVTEAVSITNPLRLQQKTPMVSLALNNKNNGNGGSGGSSFTPSPSLLFGGRDQSNRQPNNMSANVGGRNNNNSSNMTAGSGSSYSPPPPANKSMKQQQQQQQQQQKHKQQQQQQHHSNASEPLKVELLPVVAAAPGGVEAGTPIMSPPAGWAKKKAAKWGDYDDDSD
jgi:hypothetical protein